MFNLGAVRFGFCFNLLFDFDIRGFIRTCKCLEVEFALRLVRFRFFFVEPFNGVLLVAKHENAVYRIVFFCFFAVIFARQKIFVEKHFILDRFAAQVGVIDAHTALIPHFAGNGFTLDFAVAEQALNERHIAIDCSKLLGIGVYCDGLRC